MIAIDTNLLVYAHRRDMEFHERACEIVTECAESDAPWALPWPCGHEFLAIVTNPRVFKSPTPLRAALEQLRAWCSSPSLRLLSEDDSHLETLASVLTASKVVGGKVHDARIAALCVAHGVRELWTADRDFSRFSGLRATNPLLR